MRGRHVATALAALALGTAAHAQDGDADFSTREIRAITHGYAKCVVAKHGAKASRALIENLDNSALRRRYPMLIDGDCLVRQTRTSAKMRFDGDLYRYALADALVNRELASASPPVLDGIPRLEQWPLPDKP